MIARHSMVASDSVTIDSIVILIESTPLAILLLKELSSMLLSSMQVTGFTYLKYCLLARLDDIDDDTGLYEAHSLYESERRLCKQLEHQDRCRNNIVVPRLLAKCETICTLRCYG